MTKHRRSVCARRWRPIRPWLGAVAAAGLVGGCGFETSSVAPDSGVDLGDAMVTASGDTGPPPDADLPDADAGLGAADGGATAADAARPTDSGAPGADADVPMPDAGADAGAPSGLPVIDAVQCARFAGPGGDWAATVAPGRWTLTSAVTGDSLTLELARSASALVLRRLTALRLRPNGRTIDVYTFSGPGLALLEAANGAVRTGVVTSNTVATLQQTVVRIVQGMEVTETSTRALPNVDFRWETSVATAPILAGPKQVISTVERAGPFDGSELAFVDGLGLVRIEGTPFDLDLTVCGCAGADGCAGRCDVCAQ